MKTFKPLTFGSCELVGKLSDKYGGAIPPSLLERRLFAYIAGCASCNAIAEISGKGAFSIRYANSNFLPVFLSSSALATTPFDAKAIRAHLSTNHTADFHNINAISASPEGKLFIAHFGCEIGGVRRDLMFYDESDTPHIERMRSATDALSEVYRLCLNFISKERRAEIVSFIEAQQPKPG